ncbi:chemotaxis protein CheW [Sphingobium sp.]|uniref:chemotaxis protein CheW n=1 Tax=Sphingobium sp. TaxID=1912891 RepID=UPI0028BED80C|nr:chemotaxis protein CheW [Sphingobium sp.]
MNQLYLFATLAGTRIAVETGEVEAVVKLTDVSPVPGMGAHVAGLSALRSRVLTIIDAAALVRGLPTPADQRGLAIIADISGHSYGLMVDAIHDICQVPEGELPLRGRLDPAWSPYARGLVEHDGQPCLLVSLSGFIEAGAVAQAA